MILAAIPSIRARSLNTGDFAFQRGQDVDEFPGADDAGAMTLPVLAEGLAGPHVQGREPRRRAVAFVLMGHGLAAPRLQRQAGPGAVERLDPGRLIHRHDHRHDHRMGGRADVKSNDIMAFLSSP